MTHTNHGGSTEVLIAQHVLHIFFFNDTYVNKYSLNSHFMLSKYTNKHVLCIILWTSK